MADALIVDAPYSAETHERSLGPGGYDGARRRELDYAAWSAADVVAFVRAWSPLVRGWFVSITDHRLAPVWSEALECEGRRAFPLLPLVEIASRVRLRGDGPSSWTCWIVVARPRCEPWSRWGTLPGAYVGPREAKAVVGGKPLWAMRALVRDYSRPGDLVCDPCCGAGTTLRAALEEGRRAIGGDIDAGRLAHARQWCARPVQERIGVVVSAEQEAMPWVRE